MGKLSDGKQVTEGQRTNALRPPSRKPRKQSEGQQVGAKVGVSTDAVDSEVTGALGEKVLSPRS